MKRLHLLLALTFGCVLTASADHITGGEMFYVYTGMSGGNYQYRVTVKLFMRCNSGREFNNPTIISVFDRVSGQRINDYSINLDHIEKLSMVHNDPCITNPPIVCYDVGYYVLNVSVPPGPGYTVTAHVNFRIDGINNLMANYNRIGATYVGDIPGSAIGAAENNSARFVGEDLVVVCAENSFSYSFAAEDLDSDELRYSFAEAYRTDGGGGGGFGASILPPPPPPYEAVPYGQGFSGNVPLGANVKIDSKTGLITGIAPARGIYVVTVVVQEIRNGETIAVQRKDLQIFIAPCTVTAAALPDQYMLCDNSQTLTARNLSTSPLIKTYNWEFLNNDGETIFATTNADATFAFPDTGIYTIKLVINRDQQCSDSTMATARVYPGFKPDFDVSRPCITRPVIFNDRTTSTLGDVVSWEWDFGEGSTTGDFSSEASPNFSYASAGTKNVTLIASDSKGCVDTATKSIVVYDKPPINLAFKDTLICPPDDLQLRASGNGVFSWRGSALANAGSATPVVSPLTTTKYYVDLDDDGCINTDSVTVRVVNTVTLNMMNDSLICEGDEVPLHLRSDGLKYTWTPANTLSDPSVANPFARPEGTTTYSVTAFISSCSASGDVTITTVPYPTANAGSDTTICFNTPISLNAVTDGTSFTWAPASQVFGGNTLNPTARPLSTTQFLFFAYDTRGCPKPGVDSILVTVQPDVNAFAGNDTVVVTNQPLQLQATGGLNYSWTPAFGLSDANVSNPVATFVSSPPEGSYRYKVLVADEIGCVDSAYMQVQVFSSGPEIYVPSAFTPNNDGKNDFFQVVAAGIRRIEVFQLYNRWGQLIYNSPGTHSRGWDGNFGGKPQPPDTYVYLVKATDYTGKPIFKRGTVVLIR